MAVGRPGPQLAVVTWSIIALCTAVWLAELMVPGFFDQVALSPELGRHEPWRFITSAFAHSIEVTHLAFNMFALWSVGRLLEMALGRARYLALYLLSALGGGVAFVLMAVPPSASDPHGSGWFTGVVGASGAVFGLFGALLVLYQRLGASLRSMWLVLGLNAVISFTIPGIAWQSHLGGFLVGLVAALVLLPRRRPSGRDATWPLLALIAVALVALLVGKYLLAGPVIG